MEREVGVYTEREHVPQSSGEDGSGRGGGVVLGGYKSDGGYIRVGTCSNRQQSAVNHCGSICTKPRLFFSLKKKGQEVRRENGAGDNRGSL